MEHDKYYIVNNKSRKGRKENDDKRNLQGANAGQWKMRDDSMWRQRGFQQERRVAVNKSVAVYSACGNAAIQIHISGIQRKSRGSSEGKRKAV